MRLEGSERDISDRRSFGDPSQGGNGTLGKGTGGGMNATEREVVKFGKEIDFGFEQLIGKIEKLRREKDVVYTERNMLVAALSKLFPAWLELHPAEDKEWAEDWRTIVFIETPAGQMSWHLHYSEVVMFDHLEGREGNSWDGHTTEEKYERLSKLPPLREEGK
jgi:hypothetical protein